MRDHNSEYLPAEKLSPCDIVTPFPVKQVAFIQTTDHEMATTCNGEAVSLAKTYKMDIQ